VVVDSGRVVAVGRWPDLVAHSRAAVDLGDAILMPGFINAHCHLDYTRMAGKIQPQPVFTEWIKSIVALKSRWSEDDFCRSWLCGAEQSLAGGVTSLANIEGVSALLPLIRQRTPLRVHSFPEIIGFQDEPPPGQLLAKILTAAKAMEFPGEVAGISPHAPYTTTPHLIQECIRVARQYNWRLTMHIAESREEFEMFVSQRGALYDWMKNYRSMKDCGHGSPLAHLYRHGILYPGLLAVHMNYLAPDDAELLVRQKASVAHCPRSHAYFKHDPFPYDALAKCGVNICLGTDSLASTTAQPDDPPKLDMFEEMRVFHNSHPDIAPDLIIDMAAINGARALGLSGQVGELAAGSYADMIAIPYSGPAEKTCEAILDHRGPVMASIIGGKQAFSHQG
jgi:cytosine/adenosine deaminase-related metal-dependent hydrolase